MSVKCLQVSNFSHKLYVAPSIKSLVNDNEFPHLFHRWDKYTACGKQIEDSPFIAFKAPLTPVSSL